MRGPASSPVWLKSNSCRGAGKGFGPHAGAQLTALRISPRLRLHRRVNDVIALAVAPDGDEPGFIRTGLRSAEGVLLAADGERVAAVLFAARAGQQAGVAHFK